MSYQSRATSFAIITILTCMAASQVPAAEKLSDILSKHKWDGIIGTWVDVDTKGEVYKVTYVWKLEDRVIEIVTSANELRTVAFMGVNAKNGEVFHMGADSTGGSSLGKWKIDDNGDALLEMVFTGGDGEQGAMSIRHHKEDKDTMIVTIQLAEPVKFKMTRVKR